jgi:uncharacterized membrane protein YcaP (DUF421 family)
MDRQGIFFDGWEGLNEVLIAAPVLYVLVVIGVRLSGKRTSAKMNNFDWIVTVAMGAIVGSGIVQKQVSIAEAALAAGLLLLMQWLFTKAASKSYLFGRVLKSEPRLIAARGRLIRSACAKERITEDEITAALRQQGYASLDEVAWVILENSGSFSVVPRDKHDLADAQTVPPRLRGEGLAAEGKTERQGVFAKERPLA